MQDANSAHTEQEIRKLFESYNKEEPPPDILLHFLMGTRSLRDNGKLMEYFRELIWLFNLFSTSSEEMSAFMDEAYRDIFALPFDHWEAALKIRCDELLFVK